jgi:hypothetical protein
MGIKYTDRAGKPGEVPTQQIDVLVDIVSGKIANERRTSAAKILKYLAQTRAEYEAREDHAFHAAAHYMMLEEAARTLWNPESRYHLEIAKGEDGVERLKMVEHRIPTPAADEPEPESVVVKQTANDLALPQPTIEPSDAEKAAILGLFKSLDARRTLPKPPKREDTERYKSPTVVEVEAQIARDEEVHTRLAELKAKLDELKALRASLEAKRDAGTHE